MCVFLQCSQSVAALSAAPTGPGRSGLHGLMRGAEEGLDPVLYHCSPLVSTPVRSLCRLRRGGRKKRRKEAASWSSLIHAIKYAAEASSYQLFAAVSEPLFKSSNPSKLRARLRGAPAGEALSRRFSQVRRRRRTGANPPPSPLTSDVISQPPLFSINYQTAFECFSPKQKPRFFLCGNTWE